MAEMLKIELRGLDEGVRALQQIRDAAGRFSGPMLQVGSPLIYAWGIETGRQKSGRLARRAGPANYLRGALNRVQDRARQRFADALAEGGPATDAAIQALGTDIVEQAQSLVPVVSGRLRGSIIAIRRGG